MKKIDHRRAKRQRRTNKERSAEMRGRLIDATIELLYKAGYEATTTILVADRAGVSRGAMMHHFRSRAELLLTVAEHILAEQRRERVDKLANAGEGLARFFAAADVSWSVQRKPSSIALLEIMMAARSDPELREGMQPLVRSIPQLRRQSAEIMSASLQTAKIDRIDDLIRLHQATLRGLAIELMLSRDEAQIEAARQLLIHCERTFVQELLRS